MGNGAGAPKDPGKPRPLTTSVMILQFLDRKMVKRSPFPVYFALIPLAVIQMQGLVGEALGQPNGPLLGS